MLYILYILLYNDKEVVAIFDKGIISEIPKTK